METFVHKIVNYQISKAVLKEEDRAIYQYGYQMLIEYCINILASVLIAFCFKAYGIVLVFSVAYMLVRGYAGGYHAKTSSGCFLMSAGMLIAAVITVKFIENITSFKSLFALEILMLPYIFIKVPMPVRNKTITENERTHFGKRARWLYAIELIVGSIFLWTGKEQYALAILVAHLVLFIMTMADSISRRL